MSHSTTPIPLCVAMDPLMSAVPLPIVSDSGEHVKLAGPPMELLLFPVAIRDVGLVWVAAHATPSEPVRAAHWNVGNTVATDPGPKTAELLNGIEQVPTGLPPTRCVKVHVPEEVVIPPEEFLYLIVIVNVAGQLHGPHAKAAEAHGVQPCLFWIT